MTPRQGLLAALLAPAMMGSMSAGLWVGWEIAVRRGGVDSGDGPLNRHRSDRFFPRGTLLRSSFSRSKRRVRG